MYPEDREVKSDMWIGWGFEVPNVVDPHITIAYYPEMIGSKAGVVYDLVKRHLEAYPQNFSAMFTETDIFGGDEGAHVAKVALPENIHEGAVFLRSSLYSHGAYFSTLYPFSPHITFGYGEDFEWPFTPKFGDRWPVNFLHIEWNKIRTSYRLTRREDEKAANGADGTE